MRTPSFESQPFRTPLRAPRPLVSFALLVALLVLAGVLAGARVAGAQVRAERSAPPSATVLLADATSMARLDLAAAMPGGQQVYLEIDRPNGRLQRWMGLLPPKIRGLLAADWAPLLSAIEGLGAPRVAIGITTEGIFREQGITVLIEGADPVRVRGLLEALAGEAGGTLGLPAIGSVGKDYVVAASSFERLSKASDVLAGKARPFMKQRRFRASGFAALKAPIRGFIDARAILPAGARQIFLRQDEAFAPLAMGGALATVARMQEALFTLDDQDGALRFELVSDGGEVVSRFAFLAPNTEPSPDSASSAPAPKTIRRLRWSGPPPIARLSFTRDLAAYWAAREELVKATAYADFAEVKKQSALFLGSLPFEDLLASLGPSVDVIVAPVREKGGRQGVGVALTLPLEDREIGAELGIAAQMLVAAGNFERSTNAEARFGMRFERLEERDVFVAALRPSVQSGDADPLAFLQPSFVHAERHIILASHPSLVATLLAAEAASEYEPLQATESLMLDAPALAKAAKDYRGLLIGQALLGSAGSFEQAETWFDRGLTAVQGFEGLSVHHSISEQEDRLIITLRSVRQGG